MIFADSGSDYASSKYVIHGVLFDGTSSFRSGSRWAPEAVHKASHNFEPYDFECDCELSESLVCDIGDTVEPRRHDRRSGGNNVSHCRKTEKSR